MKIISPLDISGNTSSTSVIEFLRAISLGGSPSSQFGIYYSIDKRRVLTNLRPRVAGASKRVIYIKGAIKEIGRPRGASTACASDLGSGVLRWPSRMVQRRTDAEKNTKGITDRVDEGWVY